jgi:hypothetical protein
LAGANLAVRYYGLITVRGNLVTSEMIGFMLQRMAPDILSSETDRPCAKAERARA